VAVDIGVSAVRIAEVELGSGSDPREGAKLLALAEVPVPPGVMRGSVIEEPQALAQVVKRAFAAAKPSRKQVVVGLGQSSVVLREVDIPAQSIDKVRASLAFHVEDQLPMPADEALLDFYPTVEAEGQGGTILRGVLVAAPRETVRDTITVIEAAGLSPAVIDHSAFGLWRSGCRGALLGMNVALVDVGASTTKVVVSQGGTLRLIRVLSQGGADATRALQESLKGSGVDPTQIKFEVGMDANSDPRNRAYVEAVSQAMAPLIEAIRNTLVYFASANPGGAVERLVLTGGGGRLLGFGQALASATRLPVGIGNPIQGLQVGARVDQRLFQGREQELATVIGLAMRSDK
jgi:type IV pilus assembly protein PilM